MAISFFWIDYHFEKFRGQVAIRKKKQISRPALKQLSVVNSDRQLKYLCYNNTYW